MNKSLNIAKVRGPGYDEAANMSRVYLHLQAKIKDKNPPEKCMHYCVHALNLVIDLVSQVFLRSDTFSTIFKIDMYFSKIKIDIVEKISDVRKHSEKVVPN